MEKVARHKVHDLGNSYGITLPKKWCNDMRIQPRQSLDIYRDGSLLVIEVPVE